MSWLQVADIVVKLLVWYLSIYFYFGGLMSEEKMLLHKQELGDQSREKLEWKMRDKKDKCSFM